MQRALLTPFVVPIISYLSLVMPYKHNIIEQVRAPLCIVYTNIRVISDACRSRTSPIYKHIKTKFLVWKSRNAQPPHIGKIPVWGIWCRRVSAITSNSQNCHKYNSALAIHENVQFFAIFRHVFQSGLMLIYGLKPNKSTVGSTTKRWTSKSGNAVRFAIQFYI